LAPYALRSSSLARLDYEAHDRGDKRFGSVVSGRLKVSHLSQYLNSGSVRTVDDVSVVVVYLFVNRVKVLLNVGQ